MAARRALVVQLTILLGVAATGCNRGPNPLAPATAALRPGADPLQPAMSSHEAPTVVDGAWDYREETVLVFAGDLAPLFGFAAEGPVLHVQCSSPDGVLTLVQTGSTFTGTLEHPTGSCRTKGGQVVPPPWGLPYRATLSGRVTGRALQFDQVDDPPNPAGTVRCPKTGTIQVANDVAVGLETVGRCDLSVLQVHPAMATNSASATRR